MPMLFEMYVKKDSFIHRLDPRVKILWFFCAAICVIMVNSAVPASIIFLWIVSMAVLAKLPLKRLLLLTQAIIYTIVVSALLWPFFIRSGFLLLEWGWFKVTSNGILIGIGVGFRIATTILCSAVVFMTTTQEELIESLRSIKIPEHFVFATVLAFRYIPSLMGEWTAIAEAQACRAPSRGLLSRIKKLGSTIGIPIAIPLIHRAAKMTSELSLALDSKGFNPEKRPILYKELRIRKSDKAFAIASITVVAIYVILRLLIIPHYMWIEIY